MKSFLICCFSLVGTLSLFGYPLAKGQGLISRIFHCKPWNSQPIYVNVGPVKKVDFDDDEPRTPKPIKRRTTQDPDDDDKPKTPKPIKRKTTPKSDDDKPKTPKPIKRRTTPKTQG